MARLNRAETQRLNRDRVLAAARDEFAQRGFRAAKIDTIAEGAQLTRGAVYSNFPGKRALYFAVLAEEAARLPAQAEPPRETTPREAVGALAGAWVSRLPLATEEPGSPARLGADFMPEVLADEHIRVPYAQLLKLNAIMVGLALEGLKARSGRMVRTAEAVLTMLHGASGLAAAAPGFVEPFDVIAACQQMLSLDLGDGWRPPHLPHLAPARPVDAAWSPTPAVDAVTGGASGLGDDGVVAVLGLHRLEAVEEAMRAAKRRTAVTAVVVTGDPSELGPLARLALAELHGQLRHAFPVASWPRLRIVLDEAGALAAAAGVPAVSDATEAAIRIRAGRIVARADGFGACHAAASA